MASGFLNDGRKKKKQNKENEHFVTQENDLKFTLLLFQTKFHRFMALLIWSYITAPAFVLYVSSVRSDHLCDPWTVAHQAPLCPWEFPGKNTGVGWQFFL